MKITDFEIMRVNELLRQVDSCCLNEAEIRLLGESIHDRILEKAKERIAHGRAADGRRNDRHKQEDAPSKSDIKRRLCLSGELYRVQRRKSARLAASKKS